MPSTAGQVASIGVDGTLLAGRLSRRDLALVRQWAALHREELQANWDRARRQEPLQKIEPLA
jgi:hypothetical protein